MKANCEHSTGQRHERRASQRHYAPRHLCAIFLGSTLLFAFLAFPFLSYGLSSCSGSYSPVPRSLSFNTKPKLKKIKSISPRPRLVPPARTQYSVVVRVLCPNPGLMTPSFLRVLPSGLGLEAGDSVRWMDGWIPIESRPGECDGYGLEVCVETCVGWVLLLYAT